MMTLGCRLELENQRLQRELEVEAKSWLQVREEAPEMEDGAGAVTSVGQTKQGGADQLPSHAGEITTEYNC